MIKRVFSSKNSKFIFSGLLLIFLFFLLRIFNLTLLPVFADEAIYIRWAQVMKAEPTLRFLPLSDGKQPFFMWVLMGLLRFIKDPLFAGRFLSVLSGLGSLVGLYLLSFSLFKNKSQAFFSALFYVILPVFVFFDRMALVDSMLLMFAVWVFYFGFLFVKLMRLDLAMITGILLGLSLLTKSPAIFFVFLLPLTLIFHPLKIKISLKKNKKLIHFLKSFSMWGVIYAFGFAMFNILRLGPNFHMIGLRNKDYVFSFSEILSHPLDPLKPHISDLASWFPNLLTWPVLILSVFGFLLMVLDKKHIKKALWLFALFFIPLFAEALMAKVFTPRYILFTLWPLLIFAGFSASFLLGKLKARKEKGLFLFAFILLVVFTGLRYDFLLISNPEKAPLPRRMRSGYLEEWSAGQGIKETADYLKNEAKSKNVLVGTEGYFGTTPDGLQIYLEKAPNATVIGVGYPVVAVNEKLINSLVDNDVYLVVNESRLKLDPKKNGLELIGEFEKAKTPQGYQDKLLLFKLEREFYEE